MQELSQAPGTSLTELVDACFSHTVHQMKLSCLKEEGRGVNIVERGLPVQSVVTDQSLIAVGYTCTEAKYRLLTRKCQLSGT